MHRKLQKETKTLWFLITAGMQSLSVMFSVLLVLFQFLSFLGVEGSYHSRLKDACEVYQNALPSLFDDVLKLFRDLTYYTFVSWPELPAPQGSEKNVDKNTLAKGSLEVERSLLRVQALIVKDVGHVLDEIANTINLASILKKARASGFKFHVI